MDCEDTINGGGGEIRTLGGLSPSPVFKTGAFNRSATPPQREKRHVTTILPSVNSQNKNHLLPGLLTGRSQTEMH